MALYRGDGTLVRKLGDAWTPEAARYAWGKAELFTISSEDGAFQLPAYWVLPPDFDPRKQYAVVFSIYGGPDAGTPANWPTTSASTWTASMRTPSPAPPRLRPTGTPCAGE